MLCIIIHFLITYYKKSTVIRKSYPLLLNCKLVGLSSVFASLLLYLDEPQNFSCIARVSFQVAGFCLLIVPLIFKGAFLYYSLHRRLGFGEYQKLMLIKILFLTSILMISIEGVCTFIEYILWISLFFEMIGFTLFLGRVSKV